MKKIYYFFVLLLLSFNLFSQTTVTVGSGTNASTSFEKGNPIFRSSATSNANYSQSVQLLSAADLTTAGISNGGATITKIGYFKTNEHTLETGRTATLKVYLKNSNATNLVETNTLATWTTGATLCYNNSVVSSTDILASPGWVDFNLSTPFTYTGGAIEVVLDWSVNAGSGNPTTGSFLWQYSTTTTNNAVGISSNSPISASISTLQTKKFNTKITYNNIVCTGTPAPGNTISSNITPCAGPSFSTTLSTQNSTLGTNVNFQWYNSTGIINGATNATYNATITAASNYYCAVTCGGNTVNSNAISLSPVNASAVPITENFETALPNCWQEANNGNLTTGPSSYGSSDWEFIELASSLNTSSARIRLVNVDLVNDWLVSNLYNIPAAGYELKFDAYAIEAGSVIPYTSSLPNGYSVEVLVSTNFSNWTTLYTYNSANTISLANILSNRINLNAYAGQNVHFALRGIKTTLNLGDIDFFIDNFQIRLQETCPLQTGVTIANIAPNSADISWDDLSGNGATGYEYVITTSSTPPNSGTATTSVSLTASGLIQATYYYLHVRPTCGVGIYGDWSSSIFRTPCGNINTFPAYEEFNAVAFDNEFCWERRSNGDLTTGPGPFDDFGNSWVYTDYGNTFGNTAIGIGNYDANMNEWILSPNYILPNTNVYEVAFNAKVTETGQTTPPTTPWDVGDGIQLLYSTNSTAWTVLHTFNASNLPTGNFAIQVPVTGNVRFGFRSVSGAVDGDDAIDFFADNFQVRLYSACPYVTGLTVNNYTHNNVDASWNNMAGAVGYEYAVTLSATPPATGTASIVTNFTQTGLIDGSTYYIHVRSNCGGGNFGLWETTSFNTTCAPVTEFEENFDTLFTNGNGDQYVAPCWYKIGTDAVAYFTYSSPNSNPITIAMYRLDTTTTTIVSTQPVSNLGSGTHRIRFDMRSIDTVGDIIEVGYLTNITDENSFVPLNSFTCTSYNYLSFQFAPTAGSYSNYLAFRNISTQQGGVYIDNVVWEVKPTCPAPNVVVSNILTTSANLSWTTVTPVSSFEYVLNTTSTVPVTPGTPTNALLYTANSLTAGIQYFFHVRSVCAGSYSEWTTITFYTKPANDDCINAITLQNGANYNTYTTNVTNFGATAGPEGNPFIATGCSGYDGGDVWYRAIVPASGNITIETGNSTLGESGIDTVLIFYTGTCGSLTALSCDDDGAATAKYSKKSFTGLTPGTSILIRAYEYSNNLLGNFGIAAYDASLSTSTFEKQNFKVYPNPFNDILNIENINIGDTIEIFNTLGQTVFSAISKNEKNINLSSITTKGIYFLKINNNAALKIIKE